eukprot:CAMPEP_0204578082 /NCGR_PEP_ID=MMETSP0661-20131031/42714_1 /ASSEMBLY_ACC=CAM_ASM_000606 /TAXON_ID=109239 /ORGANISM="Alexandrium margalefi, Strain AMGDE01CS-322" /LENGTH=35 /DNA_ID= /DNA_START= /DNA_END= /DNA_ORIENTATION=
MEVVTLAKIKTTRGGHAQMPSGTSDPKTSNAPDMS